MAAPESPGSDLVALPIRDDALAPPTSPHALLRQLGLRARKSYSQSFLTDVRLTEQIANAADLTPTDQVLEVGPGLGILTQTLARRVGRVVAVELDRHLAAVLPRLVPGNVEIVHGDALTIDVAASIGGPYKVVANLPYQITSPFLFRYLSLEPRPALLVVMIQREVAERIAAPAGQLSYLAVAVQSAARARIVRLVPPGAFFPRPKIESAVIRLDPLAAPLVPFEQREAFLGVVRAGFTQPRKTLLNSLGQGLGQESGWERAGVRALLDTAGIAPERRPQELSLREWRALYEAHSQARPAPVA
jgi:16S rRNA (adenine1518-N6/adenine1519-N6)-dimethyltransferase